MIPLTEVHTKTGARVRLFDGGAWPAVTAEHGPGVMLVVDMPNPGDLRHVEVFLDYAAAVELFGGLYV